MEFPMWPKKVDPVEPPDMEVLPETDAWHPTNPDAYGPDGLLRDLTEEEVQEHSWKDENDNFPDARPGEPMDHDGDVD